MASDELDKVELPALEQLQSLGWSYIEGAKLSPDESDERSSLKDVVLEKRLTDSLKRINPWINDENLRKVIRELTRTLYPNLVEANQGIWTQINQCISVMQDLGRGNKGQTVHIIDFENPQNNEFLCTNQFKVSGVNQNIIPDILCFVNGLPLAVIECKSPYITNPMEAGIDQLLRYANRRTPENDEGAEKLFHYNSMMVSTYRDKARVGTITSRMEHYLEWKDPYPFTLEQVHADNKLYDAKGYQTTLTNMDPIPMPELLCGQGDDHYILRDGPSGLYLEASKSPRIGATRAPLMAEILHHKVELDPKYHFLLLGPVKDPKGNPSIIRYDHKAQEQYIMSEVSNKASGWSATYVIDRWVEEVADIKAPVKKASVNSQQVLIVGLFSKANFLDILQNFTVFEPVDGRIIKKIPRYQQFRAVHKTIERLKDGESPKEKSGVIWHTQGSGKSLTMVFLTIKMRRDPELRDYKLVFLTDRTQLDNQLTSTFSNAQGETIRHADSVKSLKELLASDASDIITAMVQKFQESADDLEFPVLNNSEKIIILADEAHRTQYGALGAAINTALPNAPRIAFTGTPLIKSQKTTNTFGSYIDTYTIEEAVKDGATVQILYEGREAMLRVTGDSLDDLFDEYFADRSEDEKAAIKKKFGTNRAVLEAPHRIRRVSMDILKHYREHIQPNGFKAMIVTSSRDAAILYKEALDKLEAPQSAVIISGDHNDEKRFWDYTDGTKQKKQIEDFKKPLGNGEGQSDLSILIVKDMLLTGFDAPVAQVMYLDRKLTDHTLLQAIARVNRTNKNKFRGYIVDYFGLSDYLTEALEIFSNDDVEGALVDLKDEIPVLKNTHTRVLSHFDSLDLDDLDACILALEDEVIRQSFQTDFQIFAKQMDIILPDPASTPFIRDLRRLGKISVGAKNLYRDEQLDIAGAGEKVRELIEEHVYSTGIDPKIPPVDLLAGNYEEVLKQHKSPRAKASEVENAIKHHIKINIEDDPEYYKNLSERLEDIIRKYGDKWEDLVQMLLSFRGNIETDHQQQAVDLGLSPTELAFYNILISELGGIDALSDGTESQVKEVVQSLVQMLDEATQIVDFFSKWDEQKRVKRDIKRKVIQNFDESLVAPITERFMDLAETKFK